MKNSMDPEKYTPDRGNQLMIAQIFEDQRGGNNVVSDEIKRITRDYLTNYLRDIVLPNPEDGNYTLPAFVSYTEMYQEFCDHYAKHFGDVPMSRPTFTEDFKKDFPFIKSRLLKKTDYCDQSCIFQTKLKAKNLTVDEKLVIRTEYNEHKEQASQARKAYSDHRLKTAKEDGSIVLSFDFAENILVPYLTTQPSSFYFISRRKIDLFGICDENSGIQTNYVIDECQRINKGPNMVISMLNHYILTKVPTGKKIILYADNCPGQNKNQTLVAYCCYLTKILKRHTDIEINFMVVGHTKFSPDRHFGTIKSLLRKKGCFSIIDLIGESGLIKSSAKDN